MIVYGKNGEKVNCRKGLTCQRHGLGTNYSVSVPQSSSDSPVGGSSFNDRMMSMFYNKLSHTVQSLPLKEMDSSLLTQSILSLAEEKGLNAEKINSAITLAALLHRNDARQARGPHASDTYINHPLRNTLRIMRYGCFDENVIVASVLHDTVEDHADSIVNIFGDKPVNVDVKTVSGQMVLRDEALKIISQEYNPQVARIVEKVSNLPNPPGLTKEEKRWLYLKKVEKAIANDPEVFMVKFSDFEDNGLGLYHNNTGSNGGMIAHLSRKYLPLVPMFVKEINKDNLPIAPGMKEKMLERLRVGEQRLVGLTQL